MPRRERSGDLAIRHGESGGVAMMAYLGQTRSVALIAELENQGCHIGRVGPTELVRWARELNADSIDSCLPLRAHEHLAAFLTVLSHPNATGG